MADHFTTVRRYLAQAENESAGFKQQVTRVSMEAQQARRDLDVCRRQNTKLQREIERLGGELERARQVAASAQRATLEHAGRTT